MNRIILLIIFSCFLVESAPVATNPVDFAVFDSGNVQVKRYPIGSLVPDTVPYSTNSLHSDSSDTALYAHDAGHADHADTADVAFKSLLTTHGVTPGTVPKAATDSTFTNSHITENGDTTKIAYVPAIADTFINSGISIPSSIYSGCLAPNGDNYFAIWYKAPGLYIQVGGSGALTRVTTIPNIVGMTADPSGNIYGAQYCISPGCWIYKRTGGVGNFDTLTGTRKSWKSITCDLNGVLYGSVYDDTIYASYDQGATWSFFQSITYVGNFSNVSPNGDLFVVVGSGSNNSDVYKKTPESSSFYSTGWAGVLYFGRIGIDTSGNIFISTLDAGGTYISTDNLSSIHKIQNRLCNAFVPKINGDIYSCGSQLWVKSATSIKTIFSVEGGNSNFAGKVDIENTPTTTTPAFLLAKNAGPDNEIKKFAWNDSVRSSHKADILDTFPVAVTTDLFVTKDASDSLLKIISIQGALNSLGIPDSVITDKIRIGSGGSDVIDIHRRTDTLVIKISATDSLCFKAVAP